MSPVEQVKTSICEYDFFAGLFFFLNAAGKHNPVTEDFFTIVVHFFILFKMVNMGTIPSVFVKFCKNILKTKKFSA